MPQQVDYSKIFSWTFIYVALNSIMKHQLVYITLGAEGGQDLMSKHLIIINSWIEEYTCPLK